MKIGVFQKGRKEAVKSRFDLGRSMVACLILMTVSCFMFVGTTLSWFSDRTTSAANEIRAGTFSASMHVGDGQSRSTGLESDSICMTRLDKESDYWEPGAVFVSEVMWVQNDGGLDMEYRLDLLTAKDMQQEPDGELALLDEIEFRIIDEQGYEEADEEFLARALESFERREIDQRAPVMTRDADSRDSVVTGAAGVRLLPASMARKAMSSNRFVVVGMMDERAGNHYKGMTLDKPFTVVVTAQQTGTEWADIQAIVCTEEQHENWVTAAQPFADDEHGYWKGHCYHCVVCEEPLTEEMEEGEITAFHAELAEEAARADVTGGTASLWVRTDVDGMVDYFCRDCNKRVATKNDSSLYLYESDKTVSLTDEPEAEPEEPLET